MASHPPEEEGVIAPNALAITMVVMLATFMQVLDSTIANVALPHMQASLGAAADTITWVLTSLVYSSRNFPVSRSRAAVRSRSTLAAV